MKIEEILMLDCNEKENSKLLIKNFNKMKPVSSKGLNFKDDFKDDSDKLISLMERIIDKNGYNLSGISFWKHRQTVFLTHKKANIKCAVVSKNLNELYLKICVYCYYKKIK